MPQPNLTELDRLVGEAERLCLDMRAVRLSNAYDFPRIKRAIERADARRNRRVAKMIAALEEVPL